MDSQYLCCMAQASRPIQPMFGNYSDHHRLAGVDALSDERYEPSDEVGPAVPEKGLVAITLACANRRHRSDGFPSAHQIPARITGQEHRRC